MSELHLDDPLFDYKMYRFGRSRQIFRGPQPDLRGHYIAAIGGSYTFGRFSDMPFPALLGEELGLTSLNLGADGAGPGFFGTLFSVSPAIDSPFGSRVPGAES